MPPSQFLATLGRELWEPMSNVVSMTGFLLETELTRDQHEMVAELRHSGDRLLRLIRDSLDAVEIEAGLVQAVIIPFDLRVLTEETVALLRGFAFKRGMSVECRVHHEVPSHLVGDPGRLRQVLWNLCKHALEANASGGVVLRVARLHEDPRSVTLRFDILFYDASLMGQSVADGPGSPKMPDSLAVVASDHTQLQLEIARRLVGVMGTRVVVEEESGQVHHTRFDLTLEKQQEAPSEEVAAPPRASLAGQHVLVVDPTEAIRHALAAKLAHWGCRVAEAAQAEAAMAMVAEAETAGDPFRFVLIDRDLPLMGAHEFGAYLRAQTGGEALHMVLLAAVGRRGDLEHAHACGFDAYLPKPIDWQDLGDALVEIEHMAIAGPTGEERRLVTRHWLAETRRSRTRVLIVEDDAVSVLVTDWTLRRIGYQVVRVNSASDLRRLLKGDGAPFDLVVLALRLPDGDGLSLAREIRTATPEGRSTAIVALGYECTRVERDRCRAEGVDAYIARPVDLGHLCEVVERITRTGLPGGSEVEDSFSNGQHLHASRRKSAADRDRLAYRFVVDTDTGAVLGDGRAVKDAMSMLRLDTALAESMDLMTPEAPEALDESRAASAASKALGPPPAALVGGPAPQTVQVRRSDAASAPAPKVARTVGEASTRDVATDASPALHDPEPSTAPKPARQAADDSRPPLDLVRLDAASMRDPTLRNSILTAYLRQARAALGVIVQAVSARDAAAVESEAHRLSQMSEVAGAVSCAEVFSDLASLGREGLVADVASLVARASTELSRVERVAFVLAAKRPPPPSNDHS